MNVPFNQHASFREQARDAALEYMLTGSKALFRLPEWGVFIGCDSVTQAVTFGHVFDLRSVCPLLDRLTQPQPHGETTRTVDAVALAFPCYTRLLPRQPRVAVISAQRGAPPVLDAYRVSLDVVQLGIFRVGPLAEELPEVVPDLILWGESFPRTPASSGLSTH